MAQLRCALAQLSSDPAAVGIVCRRSAGDFVRSSRSSSSFRPGCMLLLPQPYLPDLPLWRQHKCTYNRGEFSLLFLFRFHCQQCHARKGRGKLLITEKTLNFRQVLPTEIGYRTLKILIQYMYSGETTVTNEQLEGVLKAGDILRVRGLWRSNSGSSKKENIQSNSQSKPALTSTVSTTKAQPNSTGQIQKIKLAHCELQPSQNAQQQQHQPQNQNNALQEDSKAHEKKSNNVNSQEKSRTGTESDGGEATTDNVESSDNGKDKENVQVNNSEKRKTSEEDSLKSKSDTSSVDNVRLFLKNRTHRKKKTPNKSRFQLISFSLYTY